jgi:2-amino-4-hydroxy-6-hydroxymethyldihydropteridine diphosphokinase
MGRAYLSLGSNIDAEPNLRSAFAALRARFGAVIASTVYRFPAVGFNGPDFLNAAAIVDSDLDPFALNDWLHALEDAHGRDRSGPRFGDRPLDIDIVFYDDLVLEGPGHLQLPRDELRHAFVLMPLAEIAPDFVDPRSGRSLAALWAESPERDVACAPAFAPEDAT